MDARSFLDGQVSALSERQDALDKVGLILTEAQASPECIAFVTRKLRAIMESTNCFVPMVVPASEASIATKVYRHYQNQLFGMLLELTKTYIKLWSASRGEVE